MSKKYPHLTKNKSIRLRRYIRQEFRNQVLPCKWKLIKAQYSESSKEILLINQKDLQNIKQNKLETSQIKEAINPCHKTSNLDIIRRIIFLIRRDWSPDILYLVVKIEDLGCLAKKQFTYGFIKTAF